MAYSRLVAEAARGFPSFSIPAEKSCLDQKTQWFCKETFYGVIYVGSLNLSILEKSVPPPDNCLNRAEEVDWEFSTTVKLCRECLAAVHPLDVLGMLSKSVNIII